MRSKSPTPKKDMDLLNVKDSNTKPIYHSPLSKKNE